MKELHPGAKWIFRVTAYLAVFFTFLILFFSIIGILISVIKSPVIIFSLIASTLLIFLVLAVIFGEMYSNLSYKNWKYEFTQNELKTEQGIIWKKYRSVPYERVQNVEIHRGILARILKFSCLDIHTAGYSAVAHSGVGGTAEGNIPAVSIEEAEKIREFLMKKIGKKSGL